MEQPELFKKPQLSNKQREIKKYLESNPGSFLRAHKSTTGVLMYRLMDKDINPVKTYRRRVVHGLENKGIIQATGKGMNTVFVLKK